MKILKGDIMKKNINMQLTAQGIKIDGVTHILYSAQAGTYCGIININKKDIIELHNTSELTCKSCQKQMIQKINILASMHMPM